MALAPTTSSPVNANTESASNINHSLPVQRYAAAANNVIASNASSCCSSRKPSSVIPGNNLKTAALNMAYIMTALMRLSGNNRSPELKRQPSAMNMPSSMKLNP
ncbi:MAG: hypothetical protein NTW47_04685 [Proteobacteria bacterium]|nr:hypothetical protein [Pseudomonadota bacterium]